MSATSPTVSINVLTFNGKRFLNDCLSTLLDTNYPNFQIRLVDNGSSDGSGEFVRDNFPQVQVLRLEKNRGACGGLNHGFQYALSTSADYIASFNDDTAILDNRWLRVAIDLLEEDPKLGIVGFRMSDQQHVAAVPTDFAPREVELVNGFAYVVRREVFEDVGFYDEVYHIYADEDDFEYRARAAGYGIGAVDISIFHFGAGTSSKFSRQSAYWQMRNGLRYCLKHRGPLRTMMKLGRILDVACNPWPMLFNKNDVAHRRMRNDGNLLGNLWLCFCAVVWNIWHLPQTLKVSHEEQQRTKSVRNRSDQMHRDIAIEPAVEEQDKQFELTGTAR